MLTVWPKWSRTSFAVTAKQHLADAEVQIDVLGLVVLGG